MRCESGHFQAESEGDGIEQELIEIGEPREHPLYYDFLMSTLNDATPTGRTARLTISEPWTCPTCNKTVSTPFCSGCGECPLHPRDLTLRGFLQQVALTLIRVDGRLIRSVRRLVTRPGALTVAYLQGQRKLYTAPLQLFFLANVLFFAMHAVTDAKVFSTPLDAHLHNQPWDALAGRLVMHRLETTHRTLDLYAPVFDRAMALNAKSLIVLMVLPFVLVLPILFHRSRRPFIAHVVFSLHFCTFLLLLFCIALVVVGADEMSGGNGLKSETQDHVLSISLLVASAAYLYIATGTVYAATGAIRALKVVTLALAVAFTVLGYRFALLLITLYST